MEAEEDNKDQFYDQLLSVLEKVNKHDLLLFNGDMNAIRLDHQTKRGKEWWENMEPEPSTVTVKGLSKSERWTTWLLLAQYFLTRRFTKTHGIPQIDHVLVCQRFRNSARDTRVVRGANIASGHQLVRTQIKLKLKESQTCQHPN